MLKKWMRIWTGIFLLLGMLAGQPRVLAAADEFEQAQLEYLSALASMAAYNDQLNLVVRAALQDNGWQVQGFRMETEDVDGRFFLVSRDLPGQRLYLLAVPGTEGKKDIRIDMRFSKILFAGNDPDSFAKAVEKKDVTSRDPLVHRGFGCAVGVDCLLGKVVVAANNRPREVGISGIWGGSIRCQGGGKVSSVIGALPSRLCICCQWHRGCGFAIGVQPGLYIHGGEFIHIALSHSGADAAFHDPFLAR